jgi:hypothetical protein
MGYTTRFDGELNFNQKLNEGQLDYLKSILGEDCRNHPEWDVQDDQMTTIDLELLEDDAGLEWNQWKEKSYQMAEKINLVIKLMQTYAPGFSLEGELLEQSETIEDRFLVVVKDGEAVELDTVTVPIGTKVSCPKCSHEFDYPM